MIFLKNITNKKNFKNYIILLIFMILSTILFQTILFKMQENYKSEQNKELYRTVSVFEIFEDINYDFIEKVSYSDNETEIIVKDYNDIEKLIDIFADDIDYSINMFPEENTIISNLVKILILVLSITLIIFVIIYLIQFINDDINTIKIMQVVGYNKLKIIKSYLLSFTFIFSIIFGDIVLLVSLFNVFFLGIIIFKMVLIRSLIIYLGLLILSCLIIAIKILSLSKRLYIHNVY